MTDTRVYTVIGMSCGHCVSAVAEEVAAVPGVETVDVVLESGALTVTSGRQIDEATIKAAVEEAGYQLS